MTNSNSDKPLYDKGRVNPLRQHFLPLSQLGSASFIFSTEEAIQQVTQHLGHPDKYVDPDGYEVEITAAAVDQGRFAWVISRAKELDTHPLTGEPADFVDNTFHLCALIDGQLAVNWEIYTYNPYFGCMVGYIEWIGDYIVMVYREKHDTYAATAYVDGTVSYYEIKDNWTIRGTTLAYIGWGEAEIQRRSLPTLELLPPLTKEEAIQAGFLSSDEDESA